MSRWRIRCAARLGDALERPGAAGFEIKRGGTYMVMEGPQFSTRPKASSIASWGCDVIGMTNMPEAKLAREAEICYATVAMVTDYDCWHPGHDAVTVETVLKVLLANADKAQGAGQGVGAARRRKPAVQAGLPTALDNALITAPEARDPGVLARLDAVAGRVLPPLGHDA